MKIELALFLQAASEHSGNECEIIHDYSGRGMFGQKTVGIVVTSVTLLLSNVLTYFQDHITGGSFSGGTVPDHSTFRVDNISNRTILF